MCTICGCSDGSQVTYTDPRTGDVSHSHDHSHPHDHAHPHDHDHSHPHDHDHSHSHSDADHTAAMHAGMHGRTVALEQALLAKNQLLAERNRGWFEGREVVALNLMSSPGSGKTSLLERTIAALNGAVPVYVIEGDQATTNDAERIRATGCPVIQVNTGTGCHLEAEMLARGVAQLKPVRGALVLIENVGNLVCPALFDLGERAKVVILSVTEGDDKPVKYPHMFRACEVMLINKTDLLPHVRFDVARCIAYARQTNPGIRVFEVSAETGEGMDAWYEWLLAQVPGRHHEVAQTDVR